MKKHAALVLAPLAAAALIAPTAPAATRDAGVFPSVISVDRAHRTATLPLFTGRTAAGQPTYYIVTESSDKADAQRRGVNYAPKLRNALGTKAVQTVTDDGGTLVFAGTVDFAPKNVLTPDKKTGFPPVKAVPGAVGDAAYSPLITTGDGIVLNAPQVANSTGRADTVSRLDTTAGRVTEALFKGFVNGTPNYYLHTDGSAPLLAALETSTYAKNLAAAPGRGSNAASSALSAIIPVINGPRGKHNPQRQGLQSALLGEGQPYNVEQEPVGVGAYSPLWDVTPAVWTKRAIARGQRKRLTSAAQVAAGVRAHRITSAGKSRANGSLAGLRAIGFVSNCPIVAIG
jgi:hypothetical protein